MLETLEVILAQSQNVENESQKNFVELKADKEAEITAGQDRTDLNTDGPADIDGNYALTTFWKTLFNWLLGSRTWMQPRSFAHPLILRNWLLGSRTLMQPRSFAHPLTLRNWLLGSRTSTMAGLVPAYPTLPAALGGRSCAGLQPAPCTLPGASLITNAGFVPASQPWPAALGGRYRDSLSDWQP